MNSSELIERYLKVRIGDQIFCFPLSEISEVFVPSNVTRLSQCAAEVGGVVNLRGEIVPVFDPRPALGVGGRGAEAENRRAVLVRPDGQNPAALLIDAIVGTLTATRTEFQSLEHDSDGFLGGVLPHEEPVILLNIGAFFDRETVRALRN